MTSTTTVENESNISISDRINQISSRLIIMSLNIHIELNDNRFSLLHLNEIRKSSDNSLISSSSSNTLIDELLTCIEYYCHEVIELTESLRLITINSIQTLNDLSKGSQLCLNVIENYHLDRNHAVQSILSSPFREDAWYVVHEIDLNMFSKCRIILIRLRIYFLLMYKVLINDINHSFKSKQIDDKENKNQLKISRF